MPYVSEWDVKALLIDLPFYIAPSGRARPGGAGWVDFEASVIIGGFVQQVYMHPSFILIT